MVTHFDRRSALHDKEILNNIMLVITCRGSRETVHTCKYRAEEILGHQINGYHLKKNTVPFHVPPPTKPGHLRTYRSTEICIQEWSYCPSLSVQSNANDDMQKIMFPPLTNDLPREIPPHMVLHKNSSYHRIQLEACSHHQQLLA